jgi:SAM-dependent methyltransferase
VTEARVVCGVLRIKDHLNVKIRSLISRSQIEEKFIGKILVDSLVARLTHILKWVWFLMNPNFDYMGWSRRTTHDSMSRYALNRSNPSNFFLWNRIDIRESNSVLEIGCNSGNRIIDFAKRNSSTLFHGFDINSPAVELGNRLAENEKITNLRFFVNDISNLEFNDITNHVNYDVVISWATLIYIHPRKIRTAIRFIVKCTKKRIILIEQQTLRTSKFKVFSGGTPIFLEPTWKRNYLKLISLASDRKFTYNISEVPKEIWNPGGGCAYALVIDFEESPC